MASSREHFDDADVEAARLGSFIQSVAQTARQATLRTASYAWGQAGIVVRQKSKQRDRIGLRARSFGCIEKV